LVFINQLWVVFLYLNKEIPLLWLPSGLYNITLGRGAGLPAQLTFVRQYFVEIAVDGIPQAMRIPLIY
jgi:hypothetical protein